MSTKSACGLGAVKLLLAIGIVLVLLSCAKDRSEVLVWAGAEGRLEDVKRILDRGADVNSQDGTGRMVFMFAADGSHLSRVRVLIKKGAADRGPHLMADSCGNHRIR